MHYKIREIRVENKLTQEELAKLSGVSRATISMLENDTATTTTVGTLVKISSALGKKVSDIFLP